MSKVYSNKALPAGTVLREWRLEEVLGVGGFGIVYKARGIYFDELVAIKEYFPSSISERQEDDTIVPVDSDSEEVHALGLKKFVEEAKLLWNLSTPSRHPNIVSVRSLFEIHGTAYMVMDFEDGVSLSKLLKDGERFNQASLEGLILPVAEGLDRAHRVGVLHRDIKPPNILVANDGRPVLIDFGSARFESGDATSTSVTFHTPPYAAIEQYVKTFNQGPWTDIYALGVVLYECVAGEKPAEVLERLHGDADRPLLGGDWPGFSRPFLAAIDAAMAIRPDERPQSIAAWLAMFERTDDELPAVEPAPPADDDDATRIASFVSSPLEIKPVAPQPPGFETRGEIFTPVPETPSKAEFKRAGEDTKGDKADKAPGKDDVPAAESQAEKPPEQPPEQPPAAGRDAAKKEPPKPAAAPASGARNTRPLLVAGIAGAVVLAVGGWFAFGGGGGSGKTDQELAEASEPDVDAAKLKEQLARAAAEQGYAPLILSLANDAKQEGAPAGPTSELRAVAEKLRALEAEIAALPADSDQADAKRSELTTLANASLAKFVKAIASNVEGKSRALGKDVPWANPLRSGAASGQDGARKRIAASLSRTRGSVQTAAAGIANAEDLSEAIAFARQALTGSRAFSVALAQAYRSGTATQETPAKLAGGESPQELLPDGAAAATAAAPEPAAADQGGGVSAATRKEFDSVVRSGMSTAKQVIDLGARAQPGSNASDEERAGYRTRQQNARTAKGYQDYLTTLSRSMEATDTDAEAKRSVGKARQTLSYLITLLSASKAAMP